MTSSPRDEDDIPTSPAIKLTVSKRMLFNYRVREDGLYDLYVIKMDDLAEDVHFHVPMKLTRSELVETVFDMIQTVQPGVAYFCVMDESGAEPQTPQSLSTKMLELIKNRQIEVGDVLLVAQGKD